MGRGLEPKPEPRTYPDVPGLQEHGPAVAVQGQRLELVGGLEAHEQLG